tara:strand:- start:2604 stop:3833 length:1230 start_codon:yes stop_codon:yes gene_type:complete
MICLYCRNQKKKKFSNLFSLGRLSYTGKFPENKKTNIPKSEIKLIICDKCKLVQVSKDFDLNYMYDDNYGYRTGINQTMTRHVQKIVKTLSQRKNFLKKGDYVLDIASNDATLLNSYPKNLIRVGVDPTINKYKKYYKNIDHKFSDFFSKKKIEKVMKNRKFKVITALAVFYDLKDPNKFLKDISQIIDEIEGIFILEFQDLLSIIKNNLFDTICHEHLAYYSSKIIINMLKENDLKIFNISTNKINGGSTRFYICHKKSKYNVKINKIKNILKEEIKYKLENYNTYKLFFNKILEIKKKLNDLIYKFKKDRKIIHGYGASTKGNVLLQFFNIDNTILDCIADRNPLKVGSYTPGTKISIQSENYSRKKNPHFYLVLPWHFKQEILRREKIMRNKGTKFIFPLPDIDIK